MINTTERPTRRTTLGFSLAALAAGLTVPALASAAEPDAALIALGQAMDVAWAEERRIYALLDAGPDKSDTAYAPAEAASQRTGAVVDRIEATRATTVQGLAVKHRALLWCHVGEPVTAKVLADIENPTTNFRIIAGILDDLATMTGGAA